VKSATFFLASSRTMHPARPVLPLLPLVFAAIALTQAEATNAVPAQGQRPKVVAGGVIHYVPAEPVITPEMHQNGLGVAAKLKVGMTPEEVEQLLGKFDRFAWPMINVMREKCQKGPCSMEVEVRGGAVNVCFAAGEDRIVRAKSIQVLPANQNVKP
jgi:hypothetical protein